MNIRKENDRFSILFFESEEEADILLCWLLLHAQPAFQMGMTEKSKSRPLLVVTQTVLVQNIFCFFSKKKNPTYSTAFNQNLQFYFHYHHDALSVMALAAGPVRNQEYSSVE